MGDPTEMFDETATLHARAGADAYGQPTYAAGREVRCRVRLKRLRAHERGGVECRVSGEAWLAPDEVIAPGDMLLYDGAYLEVSLVEAVEDLAHTVIAMRAVVE